MSVPRKPTLKIEDFHYLPELDLPKLILGIHYPHEHFHSDYPPREYRFKSGRKWQKIAHQTSGYGCGQEYWIGTIIQPKPQVEKGMRELSAKWLDSQVGAFGQTIDALNEYRADVKRLFGADCNHSFQSFGEAHYPIDIEFLPKLTDEKLPADLDEFIKWDSGLERACGILNRWSLAVLAENSD